MDVRRALTIACLVLLTVSGAIRAQEAPEAQPTQTLVALAATNDSFDTLSALIDAANLEEFLGGEESYTIFAPTDAAFEALPPDLLRYLTADTETLTTILTYHIVPGRLGSTDLVGGEFATLPSLNGEALTLNVTDTDLQVDEANVIARDLNATNGVVHALDKVLLPTIPTPTQQNVLGAVRMPGSSTVAVISERVSEIVSPEIAVDISYSTTTSGFEGLCSGQSGVVANAAEQLTPPLAQQLGCVNNRIEPVEFVVADNPIAVFVSEANEFAGVLTEEELIVALTVAETWAQVNPAFPPEPIIRNMPPAESPVFERLVDTYTAGDGTAFVNAVNANFSDDANGIVDAVASNQFAIGFTLEIFTEGKPVQVVRRLPQPLYLYASLSDLQNNPALATFLGIYLNNAEDAIATAGFQVPEDDALNLSRLRWLAATSGYPGEPIREDVPTPTPFPTSTPLPDTTPMPTLTPEVPATQVGIPTTTPTPQADAVFTGDCTVSSRENVNRREGPGLGFLTQGTIPGGTSAQADGQAEGFDGLTWYRLTDGTWVSSSVVQESEGCANLPVVPRR